MHRGQRHAESIRRSPQRRYHPARGRDSVHKEDKPQRTTPCVFRESNRPAVWLHTTSSWDKINRYHLFVFVPGKETSVLVGRQTDIYTDRQTDRHVGLSFREDGRISYYMVVIGRFSATIFCCHSGTRKTRVVCFEIGQRTIDGVRFSELDKRPRKRRQEICNGKFRTRYCRGVTCFVMVR